MKYINEFSNVVSDAARSRAPHKVCNYIQKLAQHFHSFYNVCKVIRSSAAGTFFPATGTAESHKDHIEECLISNRR